MCFMISKRFIIGGWIVDELTILSEAGAVAGAIPCVFRTIIFEGAAEMRAARCGWGEKSYYRVKSVDGELSVEHGTGGSKDLGVGIIFALNHVAEKIRCDHGVGHAPFVKSSCHEHVGGGF